MKRYWIRIDGVESRHHSHHAHRLVKVALREGKQAEIKINDIWCVPPHLQKYIGGAHAKAAGTN